MCSILLRHRADMVGPNDGRWDLVLRLQLASENRILDSVRCYTGSVFHPHLFTAPKTLSAASHASPISTVGSNRPQVQNSLQSARWDDMSPLKRLCGYGKLTRTLPPLSLIIYVTLLRACLFVKQRPAVFEPSQARIQPARSGKSEWQPWLGPSW